MKDYTFFRCLFADSYSTYTNDSLLNQFFAAAFLILFSLNLYAQPNIENVPLASRTEDATEFKSKEELINKLVNSYPFEADIKLKLSAYAELKGRYSDSTKTLVMDFGGLCEIYFFRDNCLLKNGKNEVYYIDRKNPHLAQVKAFNEGVQEVFEQINLTGNYHASRSHIEFVATHLARKNIEPFYKLFVRHLLVSYGEYDPVKKEVFFHSDLLPKGDLAQNENEESLIGSHSSPLKIVLEGNVIRGYYLDVGGEVYIEDEPTKEFYVSGEDYKYNNVTAFKLFISKLFSQSIQFIAPKETRRIANFNQDKKIRNGVIEKASASVNVKPRVIPVGTDLKARSPLGDSHLYTPYSWIGMMLGMLRINKVNIGDPDIIKYFVDRPYFPNIYGKLLPNERQAVDRYLSKNAKKGSSRGPSTIELEWYPPAIQESQFEAKVPVKDTEWFLNSFHVRPTN